MYNLKAFYENEAQRESVRAFMVECLKEIAVDRAFAGEDIKGIPEAHKLIGAMFDKLDELYGKIEVIKSNSR
jgi:hypothetical protein